MKTGIEQCNMTRFHQKSLHPDRRQGGAEMKMRLKHGTIRTKCDLEETITALDQLGALEKITGNQDMSRILVVGEEKGEAHEE